MSFIVSEENNQDVLKKYASSYIKASLFNSRNLVHKVIESPSITDALYSNIKEFLTNDKIHPSTMCQITYDNGVSSDLKTLYGHYVLGGITGIEHDDSDNHLVDLINSSFMSMGSDPSLSVAMVQSVYLLNRMYSNDISVEIPNKEYKGVTPYAI